jgi:hypothetical protein
MPGDEIQLEISFQHTANIDRVEAVFAQENVADSQVLFSESRNDNPDVHRRSPGDLTTRHLAKLRGDIEDENEHFPGIYRCVSLDVFTYGGARLAFSRLPDLTFEVLPEPVQAPELQENPKFVEP